MSYTFYLILFLFEQPIFIILVKGYLDPGHAAHIYRLVIQMYGFSHFLHRFIDFR
jgi:hypothetical protein